MLNTQKRGGGGEGGGGSPAAAIYSCREEHEFENGVFLRLKDRAGIWDFFTPSFLYIIFDIIQHTHDLTLIHHSVLVGYAHNTKIGPLSL